MKYALDPITHRPISPETHARNKDQHGKNAICGACKAEVFDHSVGSLAVMSHFNHVADSGPCPLKGAPVEKDTSDYSGDGERLRRDFFQPESIQFAFSVCQALVCGSLQGDRFVKGNFTVSRFEELLRLADEKKTWFLKGLTPKLLPFVLVANEVFDLRYNKHSEPHAFAFILDKKPAPSWRLRLDRNVPVDSTEPIHLIKHFMNDDGTLGPVVGKLAPGNPYVVSEQSAIGFAGPNWQRMPMAIVNRILTKFI